MLLALRVNLQCQWLQWEKGNKIMATLLRADLFKLRKRALGWVMLIIMALFVPLQMLPSAFVSPGNVNYGFPNGLLEGLAPLPFVGTLIMIILGALLIGSEYSYDTWKNMLTRRAGRVPFILSKVLVLVVATVIGLTVLLPLGQLVGLILQSTLPLHGPVVSISPGSALLLILTQALLPLVAGFIALMGAVIGRSSVAGIVIGIAWFLVDALLGGLFPALSLSNATVFLQAQWSGFTVASSGSISPAHLGAISGPMALVPALIVGIYLVVPIIVAAIVFRQRDMLGAS